MKKNWVEHIFVIFPTTHRFCCCTLRQGSNLCTWITLVFCVFNAGFTTALLIAPDDVNTDYDVLYWDRPHFMYPLMLTFLLIYTLEILACIFYMVGDCQHRGKKLKWVQISLFMSIPLFLAYVVTCVLWFVFLMYNDKQEALWSVFSPLEFAFSYCSNMTVKSYFFELGELYPPYWQDPEGLDDEANSDNKRNTRKTRPEKRKPTTYPTPAERPSTGPKNPKRSTARSLIPVTPHKSGVPSSPAQPRPQSLIPATPGRVPSNPTVPARGRGRGRGQPKTANPAKGRAPSNPAIPARDRAQSNPVNPLRDRTQSNPANPARGRGRGRGRGQSSPANQARNRTTSDMANPSRERTQSNPVNPVRGRVESNPANPARERTQSNPANPARGRGGRQPKSANPDRGRTPSNPPNPKKK